jgi:uncharacterized protein
MLLQKLEKRGLINPPQWLPMNTMYLTITGSHAYGVADTSVKDKIADFDYTGFCIPPKNLIFPNLDGFVPGFGDVKKFEEKQLWGQWIQHDVMDDSARKEHDFTVFSIVKMFELLRQNNPNMIDILYTPINCVVHNTSIGTMVRDNRHLFLSKLAWKKYRGYAQEQLHKMESKEAIGSRREIIEKFGYDVKFAYNIVRLLDEAEQILLTGDINLQQAKEQMKAIRRGEWTPEEIRQWYMSKEKSLEAAYVSCKLPDKPDEEKIRKLLLSCLEEHYGTMSESVSQPDWALSALREYEAVGAKIREKMYNQKPKSWWKVWK